MAKIDKMALEQKINALDLDNESKSQLLELLRERKKYGIVWEEHPEDVEERLRSELPVLVENKDKAIVSEDKDAPNHILIEGDNLEALTALSYTHEGKIDVIYIDPPYNTGNKDFVYNDKFVDTEDQYRHSKWLSFMAKRLKIAKRLLSDKGVIFISIDDNEIASLTLLCDEILTNENHIATLPTIMNLKGNQDEFGFAGTHEYTLVYTKNKSKFTFGVFPVDEDILDSWEMDDIGFYKKGATLKRTGNDAPREKRPFGYFPILVNNTTFALRTINKEEYCQIYNPLTKQFNDNFVTQIVEKYAELGYTAVLPLIDGDKMSWRWGYETICSNLNEIIVIIGKEGFSFYKKQRPEIGDLPSKKPKSLFYKAQYSSGNGTSQLINILGDKKFNNPKPIDLIKDILVISSMSSSTILDFFAGSGTTLHATMQLNAEDGGHRQCILVTNNENNICEEVTYERNKRVINGYTTPKGEAIEGLHNNTLRYYRTDFVARESSSSAKRDLMYAATDMLCIKNDIYNEQKQFGSLRFRKDVARYFTDGDKQMLIIYNPDAIETIVEEIKKMEIKTPIITYVFSLNDYAMDADFEDVAEKVSLCALPSAILNAYYKVLPKKARKEETL